MLPHPRRTEIVFFLTSLRDEIVAAFEQLEEKKRFQRQTWNYKEDGGGEISLLRGDIFEKAAVNWSGIGGSSFPMSDGKGPFFATGISIITHMNNPHAPTAHCNIRFMETEGKVWFGG